MDGYDNAVRCGHDPNHIPDFISLHDLLALVVDNFYISSYVTPERWVECVAMCQEQYPATIPMQDVPAKVAHAMQHVFGVPTGIVEQLGPTIEGTMFSKIKETYCKAAD